VVWSFKEWYRKNKAEFNRNRRAKYRENPNVREKAQRSALTTYRARRRRMVQVDRRTIVDANGQRFFSVGRIAKLIGRQIETVRYYHRLGIIPDPTYFDSRGWRLYTRGQAILVRRAFVRLADENDSEVTSLDDVRRILSEEWEAAVGGVCGEEGQ